ncbi:hypothetical protein ACFO6W_23770 [Dysgonomonas termitidis]|uniref:Uncharacterized protein n=1 Tax=Dysgonomonas termitidis TaxID=1516126 RepID=A0ABV9L2F9_9BACT
MLLHWGKIVPTQCYRQDNRRSDTMPRMPDQPISNASFQLQ